MENKGRMAHSKCGRSLAAWITKLDLQLFHRESWKLVYFVFKRSRSQHLCRFLDRMQYCHCCVLKPRWVFTAVIPHCTSNGSDSGFPYIVSPHPLAAGCICKSCWVFPALFFLHSVSAGSF